MSPEAVPNGTIDKFGYPKLLIAEYAHWLVLLRLQQVTIGSLILACRSPATEFSQIGQGAFESLIPSLDDKDPSHRDPRLAR